MRALIDPFSGVAGDMLLGALVDLGLDQAFLRELPAALGLDGVGVRIERTERCGIAAVKVDFDIPPQPHGRHLKQLIEIVDRSAAPESVKQRASDAFRAIATIEAEVHGTTVDRVHLHEVGAVDAILDVVGVVWGFELLGAKSVHCDLITLGAGSVKTAHGLMPVPAPATLRLLEGLPVRSGPEGSGELTTPTGAALVRVLSTGPWPAAWTPRRVGYGAGTRHIEGRPNVVRIMLADALVDGTTQEHVVVLTTELDDATPEALAAAVQALRGAGALDVTMTAVAMKKGRLGTRVEVLSSPANAEALERVLLVETTTIGVRRVEATRRVLLRETATVLVHGQSVRVKIVTLPDGARRAKPEFDDVRSVALATARPIHEIVALANSAARMGPAGVPIRDT